MAESKGIAMAILGIVAVIAVTGLVLLFKGGTAQVSYGARQFIEEPAQRLCENIDCQNGMGAVVLGERGDYWICGCPNQFTDKKISDWSNQWKGDEAQGSLEFGNEDNVWLVSKYREY